MLNILPHGGSTRGLCLLHKIMILQRRNSKAAVALVSENDLFGMTSLTVKRRPWVDIYVIGSLMGDPGLWKLGEAPPVLGFLMPLKVGSN